MVFRWNLVTGAPLQALRFRRSVSENSGSLVWSLKWGLISFSFYRLRVLTFLRDDFRAVRPLELAPGGASPEPSWTRLVAVRQTRN